MAAKRAKKSTRKSGTKRAKGSAKKSTRKAAKKGTRKSAKKSTRKYGKKASDTVETVMKRRKKGTLRRGKGGRGGKVTSRKQAIAIGLSEAREKGAKVPRKKGSS